MSNKQIHIKDKRTNEDKQAQDSRGQLPTVRAFPRYQELGNASQTNTYHPHETHQRYKIQRVSFQP